MRSAWSYELQLYDKKQLNKAIVTWNRTVKHSVFCHGINRLAYNALVGCHELRDNT